MLDHAGEHESGRDSILILIDADGIVALAVRPRGLYHAQAGLARRLKNDILSGPELLVSLAASFALIVPVARIGRRHGDFRIGRSGARPIARLELFDQRYLQAANEAYLLALADRSGEEACEKRALLLLEQQSG